MNKGRTIGMGLGMAILVVAGAASAGTPGGLFGKLNKARARHHATQSTQIERTGQERAGAKIERAVKERAGAKIERTGQERAGAKIERNVQERFETQRDVGIEGELALQGETGLQGEMASLGEAGLQGEVGLHEVGLQEDTGSIQEALGTQESFVDSEEIEAQE